VIGMVYEHGRVSHRAIGLSEDQRIRLRDLEQTTRLTPMEVGEVSALRMCGASEEAERCRRVLDRARLEAAADRSTDKISPGFLGGGAA
jgi:hypothetical protein